MACGFSYDEACHMGLRDYRRHMRIRNAMAIPAAERVDGARPATALDAEALLGDE